MDPILFTMPGNEEFGVQLRLFLTCTAGDMQIRHFADNESRPRLFTGVAARDVIFVCTLDHPDQKILALCLAAGVARELGARSVGFVIPYLPYMRQDARFDEMEGNVAVHFARLISSCCDWLVTVDPHLQSYPYFSDIFTAATRVVPAAPEVAKWIAENVSQPIIFGSDAESEHWLAEIAAAADCPYAMMSRTDIGDNDVEISIPDASFWIGMSPVLIEDTVSTARTMTAAMKRIKDAGLAPPVCIAIHPLFSLDTYTGLHAGPVDRIVSCNTVCHTTNRINLCQPIALAIGEMMESTLVTRMLA